MLESSKIKTFFTNYNTNIFAFIILGFCFDFINKIQIFYDIGFIRLNRILKAIFLVYSLAFIATHFKYVFKNFKFLFTVIIVLSVVFLLKKNFSEIYVNEYIRYIFILFTLPLLNYSYKVNNEVFIKRLKIFFKYFILLNAVFVLLGFLFEIKIFQTYQYSTRFGFNGVLLSQGFTPFFYLCGTTIFWISKDNKMLITVLILSLMSGLKGAYFAEFFLLTLLVLSNQEFNKRIKIKIVAFLSILFITFLLILFSTPLFERIIESEGLMTAVFSYRTDNLLTLFNQITPENYNIFIGALKLETVRLEMQVFDVILFFGIVGLLAYLTFLYFLYKRFVKNNVSKVFFVTILMLSILMGNLLYIPLSSILMFLVLMALLENKNIK
ncbi:hypothetical protein CLV33_103296 [Jejuia pallidilutea]|uniref:O-antigen ligase-like membrane protein n=2 Tax=Jejuia pallidilutea TaxID=504487 RepID=A0A362XDZ8_9FLAO|nr:hypothetical protein CLV33_103296 [Jejuia pallidilutea]